MEVYAAQYDYEIDVEEENRKMAEAKAQDEEQQEKDSPQTFRKNLDSNNESDISVHVNIELNKKPQCLKQM